MTANSRTRSADSSEATPVFHPPNQWPLLVRFIQSISYLLARVLYKFRLSVSEAGVGKVRSVDNARLVFVCNHPTLEDGITLFVLSARLGQMFHYIVAYEAFRGWMGWLIPRLGCYSIRRGEGDRASISQTLTLLKEPRCRVVIFPEGGCSYQNDTIMPFRPGAIQLPMSVLAQLAKKSESPEKIPDFYIVPLSLKYRYLSSMDSVISATLAGLETKLGLAAPSSADNYQRLRQVAHKVILRLETEVNLPDEGKLSWNERIERLRQIFIQNCENALNIEPNLNMPIRERVYKVQVVLEEATADPLTGATSEVEKSEVEKSKVESADSAAAEKTHDQERNETGLNREKLYWDAVRLLNFDAIYDGYVAESPTPERFLDTLTRLEREVFHLEHAQPKALRKACFYIGDPINLKDYLADYKRDRSGTIDRLSEELRQIMQSNLDRA